MVVDTPDYISINFFANSPPGFASIKTVTVNTIACHDHIMLVDKIRFL